MVRTPSNPNNDTLNTLERNLGEILGLGDLYEQENGTVKIERKQLHEFPDHPFRVIHNEAMEELADSIRQNGLLEPIQVIPRDEGGYYIVSGHRRNYACGLVGITEVDCKILDCDMDTAISIMVDSNLKRPDDEILPSEKAKAYKMKYDAMKRQGSRLDLTCVPGGHKLSGTKSRELLGMASGDSASQVRRFLRLNDLCPELLTMVDSKQIPLKAADQLSYIPEHLQQDVYRALEALNRTKRSGGCLKESDSMALRRVYDNNMWTYENVVELLAGKPAESSPSREWTQWKPWRQFYLYFPHGTTPKEAEAIITELLKEHYSQ